MKKNIYKLSEAIITRIECEYCDNEFESYNDVYDCAESADDEGWIVNSVGKIKCPECNNKRKKKGQE